MMPESGEKTCFASKGRHHEHQCAVTSPKSHSEVNIMRISALSFPQASNMSISALSLSAGRRQEASIMSITALSFPQDAAKRPAS